MAFLKDLQSLNPEARHLIIWDGASYHQYKEMKAYLEEINQGKERDEWPLTCVLFAPNAPRVRASQSCLTKALENLHHIVIIHRSPFSFLSQATFESCFLIHSIKCNPSY